MTPAILLSWPTRVVGSVWAQAVCRWRSWSGTERATNLVLGCMFVLGIVLRIQGIGRLYENNFDEILYVNPAHHYLVGIPDLSDCHPPLSKMLMGLGILIFGHNPIGWRFFSLCFGLQTIVLAYWLNRLLFEDRRAGWYAAAFVAADGFFIAYSRTGLPDGVLTCLVLWSVVAAVTARGWGGVMCSAILVGAAASVKWSGFMAAIPAALAILVLGRARWYTLICFAAVPLVHWGVWVAALVKMGHPNDPVSIWKVMNQFFKTHVELGHGTNPLGSPWYTWPILYHPIVVKYSSEGLKARYSSSAGNPLVWFAAGISVIGIPLTAAVMALRSSWRSRWRDWFGTSFTKPIVLLALGWLAMLLPWTVGRGTYTFWNHYMPSWAFALVMFAGVAARLQRRRPLAVMIFCVLALLVFGYFAPVWGEFPLTNAEADSRLPFLTWRP